MIQHWSFIISTLRKNAEVISYETQDLFSSSARLADGRMRKRRCSEQRNECGTDYPGVNPASDIAAVLYEDLTFREYECIFHKNAEQLLKL